MPKQATHPCERREPLGSWKSDHLYIGDGGEVLCGRCLGIESTYTPWAFSDLGRMDVDREVKLTPEAIRQMKEDVPGLSIRAWRCETDPLNLCTH